MRWLGAIVLLSCLVGSASASTAVRMRVDPFANRFWLIDQLSGWNPPHTSTLYDRARDDEALRRLLIMLHRAEQVPEQPLCL